MCLFLNIVKKTEQIYLKFCTKLADISHYELHRPTAVTAFFNVEAGGRLNYTITKKPSIFYHFNNKISNVHFY